MSHFKSKISLFFNLFSISVSLLTNTMSFLSALAGTMGAITGSTRQESDIMKFYGEIYRHYAYGWMLKTFYNVPGVGKMGWSASSSPFQFVYIKPMAK